MSVPPLPEVERLVDGLVGDIKSTAPSVDATWHIWGPATGGKSTALELLAERLTGEGLVPIIVAPPTRVLDAGPLAVTETSVGLKQRDVINGQLELIPDPKARWSDKLAAVLGWIADHDDRIVLLCDEPGDWSSRSVDDARFRDHAEEVALAIMTRLTCRRVVAGALPTGTRATHSRRLNVQSQALLWLRDAGAWGELAAEAAALADVIGADLAHRSPLEVRLLVALVALRSIDEVTRWYSSHPGRRDISRRLAEVLQSNDGSQERFLRKAWIYLSLTRRPLTEDLLERVVGDSPTERSAALLHNCLLYPDDDAFTLHWSLRLDAQEHDEWWEKDSPADVHNKLARHYNVRFEERRGAGDPQALLDNMEGFYHASHSGVVERVGELRPYFADQLDALGRALSRDFKRYADAVNVFRQACEWEPEDDYAHHYLAFNLDILAERPNDVEHHYQTAIELRADHLWWHSRWVNYLITRGRIEAARRAWTHALDTLGLPDPEADQSVYENLHLWVARLLVHRGRLDFAKEVLHGIPQEALRNHSGLLAIYRRLAALLEARSAHFVFPLSIPHDRWWTGPHLCPKRRESGELARWLPGRIDAIEESVAYLNVAQPPASDADAPTYGSIEIDATDFDQWTRDERVAELAAGRFVELAWYGGDETPIIRVHPSVGWSDRDLPPLFPDPARYLRKAGWVGG